METIGKFIGTLMSSRTQAHIFHLQTESYAAHTALGTYYEDVVDLIDSYVETAQGRYGIVRGYVMPNQIFEDDSTIKYFSGLQKFVDGIRASLPQDSELNNIVDEISGLISSTLYKLKILK